MLLVDRLTRSFGSTVAVREISFSVPTGSIFALLGHNGAGKTTTMRTVLGIYAPDSGRVAWNEKPIVRATRRRFGYLPEERGLYGKMTVRDQIHYMARLHGLGSNDARHRTSRWIASLGLDRYADRACGTLSKGNQQKVQLASAVVHAPDLLVLDEPFSGLDPVNAEAMVGSIRTLADDGTTIVLSSHQLYALESLCRHFCIIGAGEVRASGTLAQLRAAYPTRSVRVRPDLPAVRDIFAPLGPLARTASGDGFTCEVPADTDFAGLLRAAVAAGAVESFERGEPTLGEIYLGALRESPARQASLDGAMAS